MAKRMSTQELTQLIETLAASGVATRVEFGEVTEDDYTVMLKFRVADVMKAQALLHEYAQHGQVLEDFLCVIEKPTQED